MKDAFAALPPELRLARQVLEGQGLVVRTRLEVGPPAPTIVRVAEEVRTPVGTRASRKGEVGEGRPSARGPERTTSVSAERREQHAGTSAGIE